MPISEQQSALLGPGGDLFRIMIEYLLSAEEAFVYLKAFNADIKILKGLEHQNVRSAIALLRQIVGRVNDEDAAIAAAETDWVDGLRILDGSDLDNDMRHNETVRAAMHNQTNAMRFLIDGRRPYCPINVNETCYCLLESAAGGGHIAAMMILITRGMFVSEDNFTSTLVLAAENGHAGAVQFLLGMGAVTSQEALDAAAGGGHIRVVKQLTSLVGYDYSFNASLNHAAAGGSSECVSFFLGLGAIADEETFEDAGTGGCMDCVRMIIANRVLHKMPVDDDEFNALLDGGAIGNHPHIIEFVAGVGVVTITALQRAVMHAIDNWNLWALKAILRLAAGKIDLNPAITAARRVGDSVLERILEAGRE